MEMNPEEALRSGGEARRGEGRMSSDLVRVGRPTSAMMRLSTSPEAALWRTFLPLGARSVEQYLARRMPLEGSVERLRDTGGGSEEGGWL